MNEVISLKLVSHLPVARRKFLRAAIFGLLAITHSSEHQHKHSQLHFKQLTAS